MTKTGALWGIISGAVIVVLWKQLEGGPFGLFGLYEMFPAFLISLLVIYIVSRMTQHNCPPEVLSRFEQASQVFKNK